MENQIEGYEAFWGEIAPCEHLVQIYEDESAFLEPLEAFITGGIRRGEGIIAIVTPEHKIHIETYLILQNLNVDELRKSEQFICFDAEETLKTFLVNGWPDEELFRATIHSLLIRARGNGRPVRAFGEMVAIMWDMGLSAATVRLEHLWHNLCREKGFSLFCAYPKTGFTSDPSNSLQEILNAHSRVLR
jgi:hypothetical protein